MQETRDTKNLFSPLIWQAFFSILFGGFLLVLVIGLAMIGIQLVYAGRIFPAVQVGQVNIGGMSVDQALLLLQNTITYPQTGSLNLQYQTSIWEITPEQLGVSFNPGSTLQNAYQIGRSGPLDRWIGDMIGVWNTRHLVAPVYTLNQNNTYAFLQNIAEQIDQPTREASLRVQNSEIVAERGQIGKSLDIPSSIELITKIIKSQQNSDISLVVNESPPEMLDASQYAISARAILSNSMTLTAPTDLSSPGGIWVFTPDDLANMLVFDRIKNPEGVHYEVKLNENILRTILRSLSSSIDHPSENPRFTFNDETHQLELIKGGLTGRSLDIEKNIASIQEKIKNGEYTIPLDFTLITPSVNNDSTGEQLGIRELVQTEVSYFYGSSSARVQNIQTSTSRFHGLLVAPGEIFSMAKAMGEISLNTGYAEALIIYNGQTIEGIGGGVCQVSTTLFRTAFHLGFPIDERHPHAYRVSYYEKIAGNRIDPGLAGLDATVFVPLVDLKFTNDTPYWLLMETYVSPQSNTITWKFYSTSDGRRVTYDSSGPTNLVEPPKPLYRENPALAKGEIKQVDWDAQGADVLVNRNVYLNNSIYFQDSFSTHYEPWRAVYEYGPGTEGIPQQETP
jgi:vancomycin resistance protein YoaR